jgi:hypothetical protein
MCRKKRPSHQPWRWVGARKLEDNVLGMATFEFGYVQNKEPKIEIRK